MSREILFSIHIPVYNAEKYLARCLDSLLVQTYSNFEVIMLNDGSTDASPQICEDYCAKDTRFHVIHQENQGVFRARTNALRHTKGDYLLFVDADDYVEANLLQVMAETIAEHACDLVLFGYAMHNENGVTSRADLFPHGSVFAEGTAEKAVMLHALVMLKMNSVYTKCAARHLIDPDCFDESYMDIRFGEDLLMSIAICETSRKAVYLALPLYHYCTHPDGICNTPRLDIYRDHNRMLTCAYRFAQKHNLLDEASLRLFAWRYYRLILQQLMIIRRSSLTPREKRGHYRATLQAELFYELWHLRRAPDFLRTDKLALLYFRMFFGSKKRGAHCDA
ncbi:MAG: glycosyltransferase family 2 protein [Clostridiales bacterium]|nr:glycosyltransferase family 2 protein [Clostridiales bacterium]